MNQGHFSDIEEGSTEGDTSDGDVDSSDDEYRFAFLQHDGIALNKTKQQFPRHGYCLIAN